MEAQVETIGKGEARVSAAGRSITLRKVGKKQWVGTADWDQEVTTAAHPTRNAAVEAATGILQNVAPAEDAPTEAATERQPFQAKSARVLEGGTVQVRLPRIFGDHHEGDGGELGAVIRKSGNIILTELDEDTARALRTAAQEAVESTADKRLRGSARYTVEVVEAVAAKAGWSL